MNRRKAMKILPIATAGFSQKSRAAFNDSKSFCLQYIDKVIGILEKIKETESGRLLEASYLIAETYKKGKNICGRIDMGHNSGFDLFTDRHGNPDIYSRVDDDECGLRFMSGIGQNAKDPRRKGLIIIGCPSPWCAETPNPELLTPATRKLKYRHYCDLWINNYISTRGAVMWIPGSPVPMGPVSGVLGLMMWWMMNADAVRILARDGIAVDVYGDEPDVFSVPSGQKGYEYLISGYESLYEPLGGKYFDEGIRQIKDIETELGTVNRIAGMVVDTILSGGKVYNYSRYRNSMCAEAIYRRGGLLLNRGIYADENGEPKVNTHIPDFTDPVFRSSERDIALMGIFQPDDPVDINILRSLRSRGMKVVSIGPRTRERMIPEGETVPGLTDVHLGNMCDTYGLFAIPGVKRRVCPTSGLLLNQMFFAVQFQIARKLIERTGNTPRIDGNASMTGMLERRERSLEIIRARGY